MLVRENIVYQLKDLSIEQLEKYVEQQPYADIAHFALAIKKRDDLSIHRISLLIDNPAYVYYVLNEPTIQSLPSDITQVHPPEASPELEEKISALENNPITLTNQTEEQQLPISQEQNLTSLAKELKSIHQPKQEKLDLDELQMPIPLEPYHTIDYFASQGIKIRPTEEKDKLSVQVKSFTAWLKSMRKLDSKTIENELVEDDRAHTHIVNLAEVSLEKKEILTENMVEILIKQGRTNDAIATLEKLSLQDPTKSVYFATRIHQLKKV